MRIEEKQIRSKKTQVEYEPVHWTRSRIKQVSENQPLKIQPRKRKENVCDFFQSDEFSQSLEPMKKKARTTNSKLGTKFESTVLIPEEKSVEKVIKTKEKEICVHLFEFKGLIKVNFQEFSKSSSSNSSLVEEMQNSENSNENKSKEDSEPKNMKINEKESNSEQQDEKSNQDSNDDNNTASASTEKIAEQVGSAAMEVEKDQTSEDVELYCVCKKPYEEGRFMILCDYCENWYHPQCIGCEIVSEQDAKAIKKFACPECAKNGHETMYKNKQMEEKKMKKDFFERNVTVSTIEYENDDEEDGEEEDDDEEEEEEEEENSEFEDGKGKGRAKGKAKGHKQSKKVIYSANEINKDGLVLDYFDEYENLFNRKREEKNDFIQTTTNFQVEGQEPLYKDADIKRIIPETSEKQIKKFKNGTYLNVDVRYFNLELLGKYQVILMDPPWRISGGEKKKEDSKMFSNMSFKLTYNTLSNQEIMDLPVDKLSDEGFIFLWTLNSNLDVGLQCLKRWGYKLVDRLVWVKKSKTFHSTVFVGPGYYFLHSSEIILVGVKNTTNNGVEYISKIAGDVMFAPVQEQSQKPILLYEVIENMLPGTRKLEIFARNCNIRPGWLSVGNQLGPVFERMIKYECDSCREAIVPGEKRFKVKQTKKDYCSKCIKDQNLNQGEYWSFDNNQVDPAIHNWYSCDHCHCSPLLGVRFSCTECEHDVCEQCFNEKKHEHANEKFDTYEIPVPGNGFSYFDKRCRFCYCDIVGERFHCKQCGCDVCRSCFFKQKEDNVHLNTHPMDIYV